MTGPVYAAPEEEKPQPAQAPAEQLELESLREQQQESAADDDYDTPFAEPELSPIAQQTAVLMARRRGSGASE